MRVCIIASSRFPITEPFAGGLEAHTYSLARGLQQRGHAVSVFAAPGSRIGVPVTTLDVPEHQSSAAARADVGAPPLQWMQEHHAYLTVMMRLLRGGAEEFDLVLNNCLHHLPVAMASALPIPMVTTLHTPPVPWLESAIEVAGGRGTFVAVSRAMATAWQHAVSPAVILNGVDTARWSFGAGGPGAVWSGRIVPEKAPHEAIDAARLAGLPIQLAGPVLHRGYFEQEIALRLGPDVEYVGHLDHETLCRVVGASRVALVTPRWDEPYGLVAAEAMSCGTPVAAYPRGGLVEIVTSDSGRLASSPDVASMAEAIEGAARCDRSAVRRHAETAHGLDRMLDEYEALFAGMVTARAA